MNESELQEEGIDWKAIVTFIFFAAMLFVTGNLFLGIIGAAVLYVVLRWPWIVLIIIGIDALGD